MYSSPILDDTESDIPRVLSDEYAHPVEERNVEKDGEHGLFTHHQPGTLAVQFTDIKLKSSCAPFFPLVLVAETEELCADHVHTLLLFFSRVHCVRKIIRYTDGRVRKKGMYLLVQ